MIISHGSTRLAKAHLERNAPDFPRSHPRFWDLATGTLKLTLTGHSSNVRDVKLHHKFKYLFSAAEDNEVTTCRAASTPLGSIQDVLSYYRI